MFLSEDKFINNIFIVGSEGSKDLKTQKRAKDRVSRPIINQAATNLNKVTASARMLGQKGGWGIEK